LNLDNGLALKVGQTPAANKLVTFSNGLTTEMVTTLCTMNATLDGIICPANASVGQELRLLEPASGGGDYFDLKVRGAMSTSKQAYVEPDGSISGARLWLKEEAEPAAPDATYLAFYAGTPLGDYVAPMVKDSGAYSYKIATLCDGLDCGGASTIGHFVEFSSTGTAVISNNQSGLQSVALGVGFGATAGTQFFVADTYNNDTPTAGDCDNVAEVGRIAVRSGSSVSAGKGGLCACAVETGSAVPAWRCPSNP
jgi:hypothetical protein